MCLLAEAGARVIIIDPVTAASSGDKPWVSDLKFVMTVKAVARKHGCSIVVVTHPRMGKANKPLDALAGGASYPRFSQTVLWLHKFDQPETLRVKRPAELPRTISISRKLRISKARNGKGSGLDIGFDLESQSLCFAEQGLIVPDNEN